MKSSEIDDLLNKIKLRQLQELEPIKAKFDDYNKKLEDKKAKLRKRAKIEVLEEKISKKKEYLGLKYSENLDIANFLSDQRFNKKLLNLKWYSFIKKYRLHSGDWVLIIMHRPHNSDIAKLFPIKSHVVDINKEKYLFNPNHFRYINGLPVLYFYYGNPFAKLVNVTNGYIEPTISSEAFDSVLTSKYVQDAIAGESGQIKNMAIMIALVVLILANLIITGLLFAQIDTIKKSLGV